MSILEVFPELITFRVETTVLSLEDLKKIVSISVLYFELSQVLAVGFG